ncbi:TM2 domain-containing protein [Polycladidibacter stylochi]|uniref:TM2 domain-containing protein n=1 Tax=Polycladidibacter stylochi TaxID=1807766 RepID=UPI00083130BB|nr:TM2 domain-containing protein [Pseudovibrio stylochi]
MNRITYLNIIESMRDRLQAQQQETFDRLFIDQERSPLLALGLSFFLGMFGVDRFYLGQIGSGILKLITCGGLGFWWLIDLFLIMGATRRKNITTAQQTVFLV